MSDNMTRGQELMVLCGSHMRHDKGSMAKAMPLPAGQVGETPLMIDPALFGGLIKMGVVSLETGNNQVSVLTSTGLQARVPVVQDPHRSLRLSISGERVSVGPEPFKAWLADALHVGRAAGVSSVFTYRSHVFAFSREAMVSARLSAAWPLAAVSNTQHLHRVAVELGDSTVAKAEVTRTEILVRTDALSVRVESAEEAMPQPPVDLLARTKAHALEPMLRMHAGTLRAAAVQIAAVAQAMSALVRVRSGVQPMVEFKPTRSGLAIAFTDALVVIEDVPWSLGAFKTTLRAFSTLSSLPQVCDSVDLVALPEGGAGALVLRAGRTAYFLAAERMA